MSSPAGSNGAQNLPARITPAAYPTRCTVDLILNVASEVFLGASPKDACMLFGITPSRMRDWFRWGREAAARDAGPGDRHEMYLAFYLAVSQAQAWSQIQASKALWAGAPNQWLAMNPEARAQWGMRSESASELDPPDEQLNVVDALPANQPQRNPNRTRAILQTLLTSGAAVPTNTPDEPSTSNQTNGGVVDSTIVESSGAA